LLHITVQVLQEATHCMVALVETLNS